MATVTVSGGGREVSFSAATGFPPSMSGKCSGFRAWFVFDEKGAPLLRARWTDADGKEHVADVAGVDWVDIVGGDVDMPGASDFVAKG